MSKYNRTIIGQNAEGEAAAIKVDVYAVLEAFGVTDPALQHLVKKALCAGLRGHKDLETDLSDILASARRAVQMHADRKVLEVQHD